MTTAASDPHLEVARLRASGDAIAAEVARRAAEKFRVYFPDCRPTCQRDSKNKHDHRGPNGEQLLCRVLYARHIQWMQAGADYEERLFMAANQIGKSEAASFEVTCHVTGEYPEWWQGRRFDGPTEWWVAGDTMLTTRNILQRSLMGPPENVETREWSGMIPRHLVLDVTRKSGGVALCLDTVWIRHKSGGKSSLQFLSYDQKRKVFQGTGKHGIWLDEEPPDPPAEANDSGETQDIYSECLMRTITTKGVVISTFTPLRGLTPFVERYLKTSVMPDADTGALTTAYDRFFSDEDDDADSEAPTPAVDIPPSPAPNNKKFVMGATWDDAPHLDDDTKARLEASLPPHQREARSKGVPQLGAGAIYPFEEKAIKVPDFEIPRHWPRGFGADCPDSSQAGTMACAWGALDRESDVLYIYSVYRKSQAETSTHAEAMKARGKWIPGVMDGAALLDTDRTQYIGKFRGYGFDLLLPDKQLETGIQTVYDRMAEGRLKVFASCTAFFEEFRVYRRDARGRVVKKNDHVMDSTRYLAQSGISRMKIEPKPVVDDDDDGDIGDLDWMAR